LPRRTFPCRSVVRQISRDGALTSSCSAMTSSELPMRSTLRDERASSSCKTLHGRSCTTR